MEMTNKCSVSFPCNAGHYTFCSFGKQAYDPNPFDSVMYPACIYCIEGQCTNKQAKRDCLEKEGIVNESE